MNYLTKMTVPQLKELAEKLNVWFTSRSRKQDLIDDITTVIYIAWCQASDMNAEIDEQRAMDEAEAERIASGVQFTKDGVIYGSGWNCCQQNPSKVIVFDNGVKWAVCKSCASSYTGEVEDIPVVKVQAEPMTMNRRIQIYAAQMGGLRKITDRQGRRIAKKANRINKKAGNFELYPNLMTPSGKRKAAKANA